MGNTDIQKYKDTNGSRRSGHFRNGAVPKIIDCFILPISSSNLFSCGR